MRLQYYTIPNLLSMMRIAGLPVLLFLARSGRDKAFLFLIICLFLTDAADGYLARRLKQETEFGAKLDSWGDLGLYMTTPLSTWWLYPELIINEAYYVIAVLASLILPLCAGFLKFNQLTSYHTRGAKLSAVLMASSTILLLAGGTPIPFRLSTCILALTQLEEICITFVLPSSRSNVPSLLHALQIAKEQQQDNAP